MTSTRMSMWGAVAAALLLAGCGREAPRGGMQVTVATGALAPADVTQVKVTVSGSGISPAITQSLTKVAGSTGQWRGTVAKIPAGTGRTVEAFAYDASGALLYGGKVTGVTITAGATIGLVIIAHQKAAATPFANTAPRITALYASSVKVTTGGKVRLLVVATDPDTGDVISFAWSATGGTFSTPTWAGTEWTAPSAAGSYTLKVKVSDKKKSSTTVSLAITAAAPSEGSADVTVALNTYPEITGLAVTPGQVATGGKVTLALTAVDADGDALTYAWSDGGCGGAFSSATAASPTWTAPATRPAAGTCTLAVTVTGARGGTVTGSVQVWITPVPAPTFGPSIARGSDPSWVVRPGTRQSLYVRGWDVAGATPLTFAWKTTLGTVSPPVNTPKPGGVTQSLVTWNAPATEGSGTVTATVTNASGATASVTFSVTVLKSTAVGFGTTAASGEVRDVALDTAGNIYGAGRFTNGFKLGSTTLSVSIGSGGAMVYRTTAGLWPGGTGGWVRRAANAVAEKVALDGTGNVYVAGTFSTTGLFYTGSGVKSVTSKGSKDVFLAKYSSSGALLWVTSFGSAGDDTVSGLAVDASGQAYLTGGFFSVFWAGSRTLVPAGMADAFVVKVTHLGAVHWAKRVAGSSSDDAGGITVCGGTVYAFGDFQGTLGVSGLTTTITSMGKRDMWIAGFGPLLGTPKLLLATGTGTGDAYGSAITCRGGTTPVLMAAGYFYGTAAFGATSLTATGSSADVAIFALDPATKKVLWTVRGGGSGFAQPVGIAVKGDTVVVAGQYKGALTFELESLTAPASRYAAFLVRLVALRSASPPSARPTTLAGAGASTADVTTYGGPAFGMGATAHISGGIAPAGSVTFDGVPATGTTFVWRHVW